MEKQLQKKTNLSILSLKKIYFIRLAMQRHSLLHLDVLGSFGLTWLLMDERRCDVISMVEARDCRGGVAVSICSLEAVGAQKESLTN